MEAVGQGILALLIALTGALNQGLKHLETQEYEAAIAQFTLVVEADVTDSDLPLLGRYYRAVAYQRKDDSKSALTDLRLLLREPGVRESLRQEAMQLYLSLGGLRSELLPKESPEQFARTLLGRLASNEVDVALQMCTTTFRDHGIRHATAAEWATWMHGLLGQYDIEWVKISFDGPQTSGTVVLAGEGYPWRLELVQEGGEWKLEQVRQMDLRSDPLANYLRLKQLGVMLALYADQAHQRLPDNLVELQKTLHTDLSSLHWVDVETGEREPFVYRVGLTMADDAKQLLASAPRPHEGTRLVLRLDGSVAEIPEESFVEEARAQEWRAANLVKKGDLSPEDRSHIQTLIEQLGADEHGPRAQARRELTAMRDAAEPLLRERLHDPDPELRLTIQEILEP